jgi:RHS repeat-associated protein
LVDAYPEQHQRSPVISFSHLYNDANLRVQTTLADGSFWAYTYDKLGQVKSGKKYWNDWTPVAGQQFDYSLDDIGNRTQTKTGGDENSANPRVAGYANNRLNQITSRDVPGAVDVMGVALAGSTVAVNNGAPYRHAEYFRKELTVANGSTPVWQEVDVTATGETPVVRHTFVPQTAESFTPDADGNLLQDGRWACTWDAENRLVQFVKRFPTTDLASIPYPSAQKPTVFEKVTYEYDAQGRRIAKRYYTTAAGTTPFVTYRYFYDNWNLLAVLDPQSSILASFTWGLDLSGSVEGAGGVGGLLGVKDSAQGFHFAAFDGNGNVAALVKASDGTVTANYEYGPFGETIRATGPMASANPMQFSTKFTDDESGMLYYGYRSYNPNVGRWLSRDPIQENGGENMYWAGANRLVSEVDLLGLCLRGLCAVAGPVGAQHKQVISAETAKQRCQNAIDDRAHEKPVPPEKQICTKNCQDLVDAEWAKPEIQKLLEKFPGGSESCTAPKKSTCVWAGGYGGAGYNPNTIVVELVSNTEGSRSARLVAFGAR